MDKEQWIERNGGGGTKRRGSKLDGGFFFMELRVLFRERK